MAKNKNTNTFSDEMNQNKTANRTAERSKNRASNSASRSCHKGGESNYAGTDSAGKNRSENEYNGY